VRFITFLIIAGLMLALAGTYSPVQAVGSTFVVNSTANDFNVAVVDDGDTGDGVCDTGHLHTEIDAHTFTGVCTLRAAIQQANNLSDLDTIAFNIPGQGPHTIQGGLVTIREPVIINGFTQPGATANTNPVGSGLNTVLKIVLTAKLIIGGEGSIVKGLALSGGIRIGSVGNHRVEGNFIGTDATGMVASGTVTGVEVASPNTTVGGTTPAARNLISGNQTGVHVNGSSGTKIEGNLIGTDAAGTASLANTKDGILAESTAKITIGGLDAAARNVISGNVSGNFVVRGIRFISDVAAEGSGRLVQGNFIGTDVTGTVSLGNFRGIDTRSVSNVLIGGTVGTTPGGPCTGACNLISGNLREGVILSSTGSRLEGNYIGTDVTGTAAVMNQDGVSIIGGSSVGSSVGTNPGVSCSGGCNLISGNKNFGVQASSGVVKSNFIGTDVTGTVALGNGIGVTMVGSGATIGGTTAGDRNLISGNKGQGVVVQTDNNTIQGNYIGTDLTGTKALANKDPNTLGSGGGVLIFGGSNNTIGGTTGTTPPGTNATADCTGACNLISANGVSGIGIAVSANNNIVQGNFIGTDHTGAVDLGNDGFGITIGQSSTGNIVGGTTASARNLISGNGKTTTTTGDSTDVHADGSGIFISTGATGTKVQGNFIGTDFTGTKKVSNKGSGVFIGRNFDFASQDSTNNIIGGTTGITPGGACTGACNLISGNLENGVLIKGDGSTGNQVLGNVIGIDVSGVISQANVALVNGSFIATSANGAAPLGNALNGIQVDGSPDGTKIADNTTSKNGKNGIELNLTGNIPLLETLRNISEFNANKSLKAVLNAGVDEVINYLSKEGQNKGNGSTIDSLGKGTANVTVRGETHRKVGPAHIALKANANADGTWILGGLLSKDKMNFFGEASGQMKGAVDVSFGKDTTGSFSWLGGVTTNVQNGLKIREEKTADIVHKVNNVEFDKGIFGIQGDINLRGTYDWSNNNFQFMTDTAGKITINPFDNVVASLNFGNTTVSNSQNAMDFQFNGAARITAIWDNSTLEAARKALGVKSLEASANATYDNIGNLTVDGGVDVGFHNGWKGTLSSIFQRSGGGDNSFGFFLGFEKSFGATPDRNAFTGVTTNQTLPPAEISIIGSTIQNSGGPGVLIRGQGVAKVLNSTITNNNGPGIVVQDNSSSTITGNTISSNNGPGILVDTLTGQTISNNTFTGNTGPDVQVGTLNGAISGTVTLQGRTATFPTGVGHSIATVTLSPGGQVANVAADGTFNFANLSPGTLTLTAAALGYLSAQRTGVVVGGGVTEVPPAVELRAGLVNGDNVDNINDITATVASFGQAVANRTDAQGRIVDLNGDGVVNINDITAVVSNFGKTSPQPWP